MTGVFVKFSTPEGPPMYVRSSRVLAFTGGPDGTTHIMLGGSLGVVVSEAPDEVERALTAREED
ncbi:hypothetical protein GVN24_24560 [Rhizobium sp. CRIBSB]|nr:hypothetical protein [Rhizobium sp. CRIBSB]